MIRPIATAAAFALMTGTAWAQAGSPGENFMLQWDADSDGQVTLAEATERRASIFEMFDSDGDGVFSEAEFDGIDEHKALEAEAGHGPGHGGQQGMGKGRGQGKGQRQGMMGQGQGSQQGMGFDQPARDGMAMFDTDGDGKIVRAEFVDGTAQWFTMRDRNGDGAITSADFGR